MGRGKRFQSERDNGHEDGQNQKRRLNRNSDEKTNNQELVLYRILCPDTVIGSVIGKNGKVINAIRNETHARVKVVDPFPGSKDRVINVYCLIKERKDIEVDDMLDYDQPLCSAQVALLRVHDAISSSLASAAEKSEKARNNKEECRILVPSSQAANVIGKAGSTINMLRSKSRAAIKVTSKDASDSTQSCAMDFDNFVLISGGSEAVKKALFAVSAVMYKFSPKEHIPLDTDVQDAPPSIIIPSDVSIYQQSGLYRNVDPILHSRAGVPPILGALPLADLQGYSDTTGNAVPIYSSPLPMVPGFGGSPRSEELIIKVLCAFDFIGRVIGKGGSTIKGVRQASGASVEVNDSKLDRDESVITITAQESPDDLKSMAVEAVLLLQEKINGEDEETASMRLLIPSKVIGCIIGKGGSVVNEIRKRTKAEVRISKGNKPKCANATEELVEVSGEVGNVRDALIQIVLRLRDGVLKDKDDGARNSSARHENTRFSGISAGRAVPSLLPHQAHLGFDRRAESGNAFSSGSLYGYGNIQMGEAGYGSVSSYSSKLFGGLPSTTLEILVPGNAVGKVMGKGGANLTNIRTISGAIVEISDSKSSRGDRIALISGTPEQKRTAENLIQAFIMST